MCWCFFLINFIKRDSNTGDSCEYCEMLSTAFCIEQTPAHSTFPKFYAMIKFFCYISYAIALFSFITLVLVSEVHCYFV